VSDKLKAVFGDPVDEGALRQINTVLEDERAVAGALMADHHLGYSMPIGGVVAYEGAISPSGVGFDIACGNKAVRLDVQRSELGDLKPWMRQIQKNVAFGIGRKNETPVDDILFESSTWSDLMVHTDTPSIVTDLREKAIGQLGTVGSGNHYVDLLEDEEGFLWIACHFGSRGLGHTLATWFLAVAQGGKLGDRMPEREEPAVLDTNDWTGGLYIRAMELAGQYAYAGRDAVITQVRSLLGNPNVTFEVHNHHNYAWLEDGLWVVRKGATPLTLEPAFIGGSMGDVSVIVQGAPDKSLEGGHIGVEDIGALESAPHGAGRVMSRTAAAGKLRKMWQCGNWNCDFPPERTQGGQSGYPSNHCPRCGQPLRKGRMRDPSTAAVNWDEVRGKLNERGVVVLGSGADEAPEVYKDLLTVIGLHSNIEILHTLQPQGVVMAGSDTFDPYKD
jgi:tRNA-splicing ligase RtcB